MKDHTHHLDTGLPPDARTILQQGLNELLELTDGLRYLPLTSERYPCPLALGIYGEARDPQQVRADIRARMATDPLSTLESALVLLELYACNQPGTAALVADDGVFLRQAFNSKRMNGWVALLGDADPEETSTALGARWQLRFFGAEKGVIGLYCLLNMLVRYAFVYGRTPAGDSHLLGHFVEDFTPGLVVCRGKLSAVEAVLSLAAMRIGVPAITPSDYPFPFGRQVRASSLVELVEAVSSFSTIRRLLEHPEIAPLPKYLADASVKNRFEPAATWGNTSESFYFLEKGPVTASGVEVSGSPAGPMGVLVCVDAEPMDAFDRRYIESRAAVVLSRMPGISAQHSSGRLILRLAPDVDLAPERIGECLIAAIRHEFPRIEKIRARIVFDQERLRAMKEAIDAGRVQRLNEIQAASEENVPEFLTCVGCSAFAPDHVCILTPQRAPQCGRPLEFIKTGAHYGYDDMTNIHHRALHAGLNSFGTCSKGELLDAVAGEWSGANEAAARLTGGRIKRVQLHSLDEAPHTGCGCFQMIMFKTDQPRAGVGLVDRGFTGRVPDGRSWRDLHYALGGKQTPGLAGAAWSYLGSPKFLAAYGGWNAVVWASPKIAAFAGRSLPPELA
jgi:acetyl-CoA decarbonylase/synthase, CODH/ACS complex subunit beta